MAGRGCCSNRLTSWSIVLFTILGVTLVATITGAEEPVTFQQVPTESIVPGQKAVAIKAADAILKGWNEGRYEPLDDDYTNRLKAGLTVEKQRAASKEIKVRFGLYQSMEFHEAVTTSKLPGLTIFRFKGTFSKTHSEVRVVVSKAKKVAGLFVLPWNEVIQ